MSFAESKHAESFMVSQGPWTRSKDQVALLAGSGATRDLTAAMVLGKRLVGASAVAAAVGTNTGTGTFGTITPGTAAQRGRYSLVVVEPASNAGAFVLFSPAGQVVGHGNVATAFSNDHLAFTLSDSTDFLAGDAFSIDVSGGTEKWLRHAPAATTGEQIAAGILRDDVTVPDGTDSLGVVFVRDCEVNAAELVYSSGADAAAKAEALRQLALAGILGR